MGCLGGPARSALVTWWTIWFIRAFLPPDLRLQASSFRQGPAVEETKLFKPGFRKNQVSVSSCGLAFRLERSNLTQGSASMFDDQPLASRVRQAL
jgi:hypothetical protein